MTLISKTQIKNRLQVFCLLFLSTFFFTFSTASAQSALSLSISPTLFDMSANPTQEWTSMIRIINPNPYEITVFANPVNFAPQGEGGQGKFLPVINEETKGQTIAEWIDVTREAIVIKAEQVTELPFIIKVPEDAPPGGHFAALLIGTRPPDDDDKIQVKTSQIVTSLVFLKVTGDIIESGSIRSFRTTERLLNKPEATFELRFENKGNVHILPRGEIKILNMWGQLRGILPINRAAMFGNVLPDSIRQYTFTWTGEWSFADMGRYTALATLAYGEDGRQFAHQEIAFWVIPWKILSVVLLVLLGFISLFTWAIRLYIRKMLSMSGLSPGQDMKTYLANNSLRRVSMVAPIEEGMLDLRGQWQQTDTWQERANTLTHFAVRYRIFFAVSLVIICFVGGVFWYIQLASITERAYDVTIDGLSEEVKISSEEVKYQQLKDESADVAQPVQNTDLPQITIVNRSGVSGLAVDLRIRLENEGYRVLEIQNDLGTDDENTVIVYDPEYADAAFALSQKVYGALLSAFEGPSDTRADITVYVGKDLENAVQ
jgi:hypothetical protein